MRHPHTLSHGASYFADGDECHLTLYSPLAPRMFMALQRQDRQPIIDLVREMPEIPDRCQWAVFLRDAEELALETETDEERAVMYESYASDPQMRINLGIRRRLSPLMDQGRPPLDLLYALAFSLLGTPVIYYGDEIGMGDNVYLGARHGIRTPMQWSSDRNAGFSDADPARLFLPVVMDPVYGYESVNVRAQEDAAFRN